MIVEPVPKADIQKAMLADTPLEEVDLGTSSETVETSADVIETLGKSEEEKVQVHGPSKDTITREVNMEEESPKDTTREEKAPVDTICTEETVQKENIKHEKLSVMFDFKYELDRQFLSNDNLPVDTLVENKDKEEHQEMSIKDAEFSETPISGNLPGFGSMMESLMTQGIGTVVSQAKPSYEREILPEEPYSRERLPEEPCAKKTFPEKSYARETLPEERSVEISVETQSIAADTEALYEEPANVLIKTCVEATSETVPVNDDMYLTPVDILDKAGRFTNEESGIYLAPVDVGTEEPTKEDEECLYEEIDDYFAKSTNCKYFTLVLLTKKNYKT